MATANGNYSWNVQNPPASLNTSSTVSFNLPEGQTPTIDNAAILSCTPTSGSATATMQSFTGATQTGVKRQNMVQWDVTVKVNLGSVTAGTNGYATGSGQVQVIYSVPSS